MKRTDLVPLAIVGLVGLAFALVRGDGGLAQGLVLLAIVVIVAAQVGSSFAVSPWRVDHLGIGGPTFTERQWFLIIIAGGVVGIVFILVQIARS